ncbi:MAG: calcium/sodium antiporter [Candidatus Latescibacterota bacterium]
MMYLLLIAGLALLIIGAEALVRGASRLAAAVGISPLVIGLTIVAFGTSSPEFAVSVKSALAGQADIALGNVVGSNIFNVLFILGISALITPLIVAQQLVKFDVPLMIAVSVVLLALGMDGQLGRGESVLLFLGLMGYTGFLIYGSRKESGEVKQEYRAEFAPSARITGLQWIMNIALVIIGLGLLILGSQWLVESAVSIARRIGVSELVIGLTIIAAGTSLPEVATSVIATLRGERDIAVGNVVGSNIFNIMGVLGCAGALAPAGIAVSPEALRFDMPVMIASAFACLPIFFTGNMIARWEGVLFLFYYAAYVVFLILATTRNAAVPFFTDAMLYFVVPLTALTLGVVTARAWKKRK